MLSINCSGQLVEFSEPKVMGIINLTPDSFYDGGKLGDIRAILKQAEQMLQNGATFLDIGGYSSRPGADDVNQDEEINRVIPGVRAIVKEFPQAIVSIDTFRTEVALAAVQEGAAIINDISGGELDPRMFETAAGLGVPYICMHMRGTPGSMALLNQYDDLTRELLKYFSEKIGQANKAGINDLIIDPGFGFAKNRQQNFELLDELGYFKTLNKPLLVGISRKSMIYKTLETDPEQALNGTTVLNTLALLKGADILRVHDVKEASQCIRLLQMLPSQRQS